MVRVGVEVGAFVATARFAVEAIHATVVADLIVGTEDSAVAAVLAITSEVDVAAYAHVASRKALGARILAADFRYADRIGARSTSCETIIAAVQAIEFCAEQCFAEPVVVAVVGDVAFEHAHLTNAPAGSAVDVDAAFSGVWARAIEHSTVGGHDTAVFRNARSCNAVQPFGAIAWTADALARPTSIGVEDLFAEALDSVARCALSVAAASDVVERGTCDFERARVGVGHPVGAADLCSPAQVNRRVTSHKRERQPNPMEPHPSIVAGKNYPLPTALSVRILRASSQWGGF